MQATRSPSGVRFSKLSSTPNGRIQEIVCEKTDPIKKLIALNVQILIINQFSKIQMTKSYQYPSRSLQQLSLPVDLDNQGPVTGSPQPVHSETKS